MNHQTERYLSVASQVEGKLQNERPELWNVFKTQHQTLGTLGNNDAESASKALKRLLGGYVPRDTWESLFTPDEVNYLTETLNNCLQEAETIKTETLENLNRPLPF